MKKILAFGASTSSTSINQQLAEFAANILEGAMAESLKLPDFYPCAMYSTDEEKANGFPPNAVKFKETLNQYDGFIVSLPEHNGAYPAAFKNLFDWASRQEGKVWNNKPILILGTSPGARGAATSINIAANRWQFNGASEITGTFSLPSFFDNFSKEEGIKDEKKLQELNSRIIELVKSL